MVCPASLPLLPLMHTPRLPVVDRTDAPADLNWHPFRRKTKSGFCACAITFQTQSTAVLGAGSVRGTRRNSCSCYLARLTDYMTLLPATFGDKVGPFCAAHSGYRPSLASVWRISQNCLKRLLTPSCLSVRLSVRVQQFRSQWDGFKWNMIFWVFCRISVENIQISLKFGQK